MIYLYYKVGIKIKDILKHMIYEIDTRHEAIDLLYLLDELYDFIVDENGFIKT